MQHRRPFQIQPPLQRLFALSAAGRAAQVNVDGSPQGKLEHRFGLRQRFAAIANENPRQGGREFGGGQQLSEGGMGALAEGAQRFVVVA